MQIRQAALTDEEAVCRLWTHLIECYNKTVSATVLKQSFRYAVAHPHKVLIFIILIEGVVTGTASLHFGHFSTWNNNWYGHVEDMVVDPAYRGRGFAEALLRHLVAVAAKKNLARLELHTHINNQAARRLYEKVGFATDSLLYELTLNR